MSLAEPAESQSVSFVQITDPHLFDAGKKRIAEGVAEESLDNRTAFYWAILETNRLQKTGKAIDFVAFTGDFGLEQIQLKSGKTCDGVGSNTALLTMDQAATEVAEAFRALTVSRILLVPGNNDLCNEDPKDAPRFHEFVRLLQGKLASKQIVDLSSAPVVVNQIQIHGLDSATFKNGKAGLREANRADQLLEIQRLRSEITPGLGNIIFAHIPNLEDPFRGVNGDEIRPAWNVDPQIVRIWQEILQRPEVLGVFTGHFHDARRVVYNRDYSWAKNKPDYYTASKVWISPPLAIKNQDQSEAPSRGLLTVTVTTSGKPLVAPEWYGYTTAEAGRDKLDKLVEGEEDARDGEWEKAAAAYSQALSSKDPRVRLAAEQGFRAAHEKTRGIAWWLRKRDPYLSWLVRHLASLVLAVLVLIFLIVVRSIWASTLRTWNPFRWPRQMWEPRTGAVVMAPAKLTKDAPSELFGAELVHYAEEARQVWEELASSWMVGLNSFVVAASSADVQQMANSIPDVGQIKLGKLATFLYWIWQYFGWRVESGIGLADNRALGTATLRWAWVGRGRWDYPSAVTGVMDVGPMVARPLAYNIVGRQYLRQRPEER